MPHVLHFQAWGSGGRGGRQQKGFLLFFSEGGWGEGGVEFLDCVGDFDVRWRWFRKSQRD